MVEFLGKEIEAGSFIIDERDYCRTRYRSSLRLNEEFSGKYREWEAKIKEAEAIEREIKTHIQKDFTITNLPAGMVFLKAEVSKGGVYGEWESDKISVVRLTRNNPDVAPPQKKPDVCPYLQLASRHDFKQILSSGILTKEERRKCLGLPVLETEAKTQEKDND